jgi:hypothetical protein
MKKFTVSITTEEMRSIMGGTPKMNVKEQQLKVWQRIAERLCETLLNECTTTEEVVEYTCRLERAVEKVNSLKAGC